MGIDVDDLDLGDLKKLRFDLMEKMEKDIVKIWDHISHVTDGVTVKYYVWRMECTDSKYKRLQDTEIILHLTDRMVSIRRYFEPGVEHRHWKTLPLEILMELRMFIDEYMNPVVVNCDRWMLSDNWKKCVVELPPSRELSEDEIKSVFDGIGKVKYHVNIDNHVVLDQNYFIWRRGTSLETIMKWFSKHDFPIPKRKDIDTVDGRHLVRLFEVDEDIDNLVHIYTPKK